MAALTDYSIIACSEVHNTRQEEFSRGEGLTASVQLQTDWSLRYALVQDLIGNRRRWPHVWSFNEALRPLCNSCTIVGLGTALEDEQALNYNDAVITANYSVLDSPDEVNLIAESLEPTVEFQKLNHEQFRWGSGKGKPLKPEQAPGRQIRGMNLVRTLFEVGPSLSTSLLTLQGTVNQDPYDSSLLGLTFPAETLLWQQPTISRTITTDGVGKWNVTLKLSYQKSPGWNTFWNEEDQANQTIWNIAGATPVEYVNYPLADWSDWVF